MSKRMIAPLVIFVLALAVSAAAQMEKGQEQEAPPEKPEPAPVVVNGKTVFVIKEKLGSTTPQERAEAASQRLLRASKDLLLDLNAIRIVDLGIASEIVVGGRSLFFLTDEDAQAEGLARPELAQKLAEAFVGAIKDRQKAYSLRSLLLGILYDVLSLTALILLLILLRLLFRRLSALIDGWKGTKIKALRFQSLEIVSFERLAELFKEILRVIKFILILVLFYFFIPVFFSFLPWTRGWAAPLFNLILTPLEKMGTGFVNFLPDLFSLLIIAFITWLVIKFARSVFREMAKAPAPVLGLVPDLAGPTYKIVRFVILAFALIFAYPHIPGSDSIAFKGVSVFAGLLISLGSSSTIANSMAGLTLLYMRAFNEGDRVKIGEIIGRVIEKKTSVTRILSVKNEEITLANSIVLQHPVINYSKEARKSGLILHTSVTIGYDTPWRQVQAMLLQAAERTDQILRKPPPFVLQRELGDFAVTYELNAYTDAPEKMLFTYSELHKNIQDAFNEYGVQIMTPHYESDPAHPLIVPKEKWFAPPGDKPKKTE